MNIKVLSTIAGVAVLLGIPPIWPYSYYIILRLLICIISVVVAVRFNKVNMSGWVWTFSVLALLFNPIFPFYSTKGFWVLADLVAAILFFSASGQLKENE